MRFNRITILLLAAVFWIGFGWLGIAPVMAQMTSTSYQLPASGAIGGGGTSTSSGYQLTGSIPLTPAGKSGSSGYLLMGGLLGAIFEGSGALKATYSGSAQMTVPALVDRQVEIALSGTTGADSSAVFYYRSGGELSYTGATMTNAGGGVFRYTVPGAQLGMAGLEYYLKGKIGSDSILVGSSSIPYVFISNLTNAQAQRPTAMPEARYRIIGVPINISGSHTVEAVFTDDLGAADKKQWRLGSYDNSFGLVNEYPAAADVAIGRGYWLAARGAKKYGAAGLSVRPNYYIGEQGYYRLNLNSGWNQVANPFPFGIEWSEMLFDDGGTLYDYTETSVLDSVAYSYIVSAYHLTDVIAGWDGVFIFIKKAGVRALFPFKSAPVTTMQSLASIAPIKSGNQSWAVHLTVEANDRVDDGNFAGVQMGALDEADDYDMHEPPPAPEGPSLAFLVSGNNSPRRMDIRSPFDNGAEWNLIFAQVPDRTLKIENLAQIPEDMTCWLILDNGSKVHLEEGNAIELSDNVKAARMIIGTEEYLKENNSISMPMQYTLYQNYPNPFNPTTHIKFALPKAGAVQLDIFNILGQRVISLVDGELPAGHHTVSWDGNDISGNPVASGVYFYRLKTDNFEQSRKMQLLK